MLKRLLIENFQIHKRLEVRFEPITIIVGDSDSGKSSIIRALNWLCFNRPLGNEFIRHGSKFCRVTLWLDGHKIIRQKSKSKNIYRLDGKLLKTVGSQVPEEITALLGIDEINFQHQLDSPFWFALSPGQVSKELNQIVNLGTIDEIMSRAASKVKQTKSELAMIQGRLDDAIEKKKELQWVKQLDEQLTIAETAKKTLRKHVNTSAFLSDLIEQCKDSQVNAKSLARTSLDVTSSVKIARRLMMYQQQTNELRTIIRDMKKLKQESKLDVPDFNKAKQALVKLQDHEKVTESLVTLINSINTQEELCKSYTQDLNELEKKIHQKMKGRCPLCRCRIKTKSKP